MRLNLGCGTEEIDGFVGVDCIPPADQLVDLSKPWPWDDSSIEEVRAFDIIEHLPDKLHTMNELWRVLVPNGEAELCIPSTDGRGAFQDPTHVSFWNKNSFPYYCVDGDYYYTLGQRYGFKGGFRMVDFRELMWGEGVVHMLLTLRAMKA